MTVLIEYCVKLYIIKLIVYSNKKKRSFLMLSLSNFFLVSSLVFNNILYRFFTIFRRKTVKRVFNVLHAVVAYKSSFKLLKRGFFLS